MLGYHSSMLNRIGRPRSPSALHSAPEDPRLAAGIVTFSGELDLDCVAWFEEHLSVALVANRCIIVVARDVRYVDSSVMMAMLRVNAKCKRRGGQLILAEPSARVERVLEVTGLNRVMRIERTLEDALKRSEALCA